MTTLLIALALAFALVLVWRGLRQRGTRPAGTQASNNLDTLTAWPPQATRVLTTAERQAFDLLRNALPAHMILAQVPLQRFIKVPTRNSYTEWLRRVGQLNADLVVCDRHSQVIAVVELQADDEQPGSRVQRRRERMMRVLKNAQVPVHLWRSSALPSVHAAREAILPAATAADSAAEAEPAAASAALRPMPANPPQARDASTGEAIEMREPPPSTWFDDFDSAPAPLAGAAPQASKEAKGRPGR